MKKLLIAAVLLATTFAATAQKTVPAKKKVAPGTGQKGSVDYFLEIDGVKGESPDSLPPAKGKKKITPKNGQQAGGDYLLDLGGVDGESSDGKPPAPGHLTISTGAMLSQITNSNLTQRYSVQSKPGYTFSIGYVKEFRKTRLQINAGYVKGGVKVAVGDINGDGRADNTDVDLSYVTVPVQFQVYLGKSKRFFIGAGGYASFLVSSKQTGQTVYEENFRKYDAGCTASAGVWLGSNLMLQTGYNYGLVDIDLSGSNNARNGTAFLTLSYSLFSKIKYGPVITIKPKG